MKQHILVEGNDLHVLLQICISKGFRQLKGYSSEREFKQYFSIKSDQNQVLGKQQILELIPIAIQTSDIQNLGIVLDADRSVESTWASVRSILSKLNYTSLPILPAMNGTVMEAPNPDLPKIGVWIMPDNIHTGAMEDFFLQLIPQDEYRLKRARDIIKEMANEKLEWYKEKNRSKTEVHTWLAWQEDPGRSMGIAVKNNWVNTQHPLILDFFSWFEKTFEPAKTEL
jgi:hypothetical protein